MKRVAIVLCLALLSIVSCIPFFDAESRYRKFLPGECLADTKLQAFPATEVVERFGIKTGSELGQVKYYNFKYFDFYFALSISSYKSKSLGGGYLRHTPSDELFDSFGKNSSAVKAKFNDVVESVESLGRPNANIQVDLITVLFNHGEISLIADKDFAGHPAGENLGPYLVSRYPGAPPIFVPEENSKDCMGTALGLPLDYEYCMATEFGFAIPADNLELVEEIVHFKLEIPVKVVIYLQWMNDLLSNPDAPVPYKDEVLYSSFATKYNLK